jgi:hypothetical protein
MVKYAILDEKGFATAFYDDTIHETIPSDAVQISDGDWQTYINNQGKYVFIKQTTTDSDGNTVTTYTLLDITNKIWDDTNKQWRDKTDDEIISEKKEQLLNLLNSKTTSYILNNYPDIKQKSDLADKEFYTSLLINKLNLTADDIANKVYNASANILSGTSTLDNEVNKLSYDENGNEITFEWNGQTLSAKIPWEQLIKVGVRVGWVNLVKQTYYQAKSQIENFTTLEEIESFDLDSIQFPEFPKL